MNSALYLVSSLLLCLPALASPWQQELKLKIDAKVQQHFAQNSQVGIVVGVIKEGETATWSYGERIKGSGELPSGDTFFEMGSITKTYTATLLALEVTRGNLKLTDTVASLWPELSGAPAGKITLEELATHTSGLPRMPGNISPANPLDPYADYSEELLLSFLQNFKFEKSGPYTYKYSNLGMGLLGHLLARSHGESYSTYLEKNLLSPLGLRDTKVELSANDLSRAAQGYDNFFNLMPFWNLNVLNGAGVLKTTVNDLLKYARFNMEADDSTLLGRAALLAHTPVKEVEPGTRIGLAWDLVTFGDHKVVSHGGATGGYRANLVLDKDKKMAAVILSNTDIIPSCVLSEIFGVPCTISNWEKVEPSQQEKLLGKYSCEKLKLDAEIFLESGILGLKLEGQPKIRLWAKSATSYAIPDVKAKVDFTDAGFSITQNGETLTFAKLSAQNTFSRTAQ